MIEGHSLRSERGEGDKDFSPAPNILTGKDKEKSEFQSCDRVNGDLSQDARVLCGVDEMQ